MSDSHRERDTSRTESLHPSRTIRAQEAGPTKKALAAARRIEKAWARRGREAPADLLDCAELAEALASVRLLLRRRQSTNPGAPDFRRYRS